MRNIKSFLYRPKVYLYCGLFIMVITLLSTKILSHAATEVGIQDIYHRHLGSASSGDGCYTIADYHAHTGSSNGGGCYTTPNIHHHIGNSSSNGGCYTSANVHRHSGSSSTNGGCYTIANAHHHVGNSSSNGGCYTVANTHRHSGSSSNGGGCYSVANTHHHSGSSSSGGGCYSVANTHHHSGSSSSGGGCYSVANTHHHSGSSSNGGGCYTVANTHHHSGSSSSGGGCYSVAETHHHSGSSYYGGGCYTIPNIHHHTGNSTTGGGCYVFSHYESVQMGCDGSAYCSSGPHGPDSSGQYYYVNNCPICGDTIQTYGSPGWGSCPNSNYQDVAVFVLGCGASEGQIVSYSLGCNLGEGQITGYSLGCKLSDGQITSYSLGCKLSDGQVTGYSLGCKLSEGQVTSYSLGCKLNDGQITSYSLGCGLSDGQVTSYGLSCGLNEGQITSYGLSCGLKDGQITSYGLSCGLKDGQITNYSLGCNKTEKTIEGYLLGCDMDEDNPVGIFSVSKSEDEWSTSTTLDFQLSVPEIAQKPNPFSVNGTPTDSSYVVSENGEYLIELNTIDGYIASPITISIDSVDTTAPEISDFTLTPDDWTNENIILSIDEVLDLQPDNSPGAGLGENPFSYDNGETWTDDPTHPYDENGTYEVLVRDSLGNESSIIIEINNIDKTGPVLSGFELSPTEWTNESVLLSLGDITDIQPDASEGCGLAEKPISYDGGLTWTDETTNIYDKNGTYEIVIRDAIGNESKTSFDIKNIDKFEPRIVTLTYDDTPDIASVTINVEADDLMPDGNEGSGLHETPYSYDGGQTWTKVPSLELFKNADITLWVRDKLSNIAEKLISIKNIFVPKSPDQNDNLIDNPTSGDSGANIDNPVPDDSKTNVDNLVPDDSNETVDNPVPDDSNDTVDVPVPDDSKTNIDNLVPDDSNETVDNPVHDDSNGTVDVPVPDDSKTNIDNPVHDDSNNNIDSPVPNDSDDQADNPSENNPNNDTDNYSETADNKSDTPDIASPIHIKQTPIDRPQNKPEIEEDTFQDETNDNDAPLADDDELSSAIPVPTVTNPVKSTTIIDNSRSNSDISTAVTTATKPKNDNSMIRILLILLFALLTIVLLFLLIFILCRTVVISNLICKEKYRIKGIAFIHSKSDAYEISISEDIINHCDTNKLRVSFNPMFIITHKNTDINIYMPSKDSYLIKPDKNVYINIRH